MHSRLAVVCKILTCVKCVHEVSCTARHLLGETNMKGGLSQWTPASRRTRESGTVITATRMVSPGLVATYDRRQILADWLADSSGCLLPRLLNGKWPNWRQL